MIVDLWFKFCGLVVYMHMYHFVWADQVERQGYKSLKGGIQIRDIDIKSTINCGFEFVDNM